jgi:hypothetical protein
VSLDGAPAVTLSSRYSHPSGFITALKSSLGFVRIAKWRLVGCYNWISTIFYWKGRGCKHVGLVSVLVCHLLLLNYQEFLRSMLLCFGILSGIGPYYLVILLGAVAEYALPVQCNT